MKFQPHSHPHPHLFILEQRRERELFQANVPKEQAKIENLDSYVELLYEDEMDEMVKGTYLILQVRQVRHREW